MGLDKGWPNICQALDGQKFQELADVPPPVTEGPKKHNPEIYVHPYGRKRTGGPD
jgi:5-methylcytosine-specific restriction protein B